MGGRGWCRRGSISIVDGREMDGVELMMGMVWVWVWVWVWVRGEVVEFSGGCDDDLTEVIVVEVKSGMLSTKDVKIFGALVIGYERKTWSRHRTS